MSTSSVVIRRAAAGEGLLLVQLNRHVHDPHAQAEPELYRAEPDPEEVSAWFAAQLAEGGLEIYVAEVDEEPGDWSP